MTARTQIIEYLRKQLIGPVDGPKEVVNERPFKRYAMGILFPQDSGNYSDLEEDEVEETSESSDSGITDSSVSLSFQRLPSSFGISFVLPKPSSIKFHVKAAKYSQDEETKGNKRLWIRRELDPTPDLSPVTLDIAEPGRHQKTVLEGLANLDVLIRPHAVGFLITASLVNKQLQKGNKTVTEKCLFQTGLKALVSDADKTGFARYPSRDRLSHDDEDRELALIYRGKAAYAIGHGCAAMWDPSPLKKWVCAKFMPEQEVKPLTAIIEGLSENTLSLQYLSDPGVTSSDLKKSLSDFLTGYRDWISECKDFKNLPKSGHRVANRIIARLEEASDRIERGINILTQDDSWIRESFRLANQAMLRQMIHGKIAQKPLLLGEGFTEEIDYRSEEYKILKWYPFQLAFQLLSLPSLAGDTEKDMEERDLVDLIWFPTGGGKTEAYLAVAAFEMIARRLRFGDEGAGTSVIKRYTLRLLTTQQFERAATLITALELIRREEEPSLGTIPFSLGLWVGGDSTPNKFVSNGNGSHDKYQGMLEQIRPSSPFQIQKCPHCGTRLVPEKRSKDESHYGFISTETSFKIRCPDSRCPCFSAMDDSSVKTGIPVNVVDQHLYAHPPSLLIGTIDKFAQLTWTSETRSFFGVGESHRPPSLIIQDELHLISGPLGTIAGVYESAIDTIITHLGDGLKPKIIAATATIRRADEQSQRIYGRKVRVFPPPGTEADNSYFSRTDNDASGRLYLGVMAQGHTPIFSEVMLASAASQAPVALGLKNIDRDTYWTQVIYHNSRRELGKTMTLARDDIPSRITAIEKVSDRRRNLPNVEELSANRKGWEIPEVLEQLAVECPHKSTIDILPCTNMISVGVDVSRLGLMTIIGQPKTTAEYIQASSRVGRNKERPGLVITLYSASKPRDRSHYESFTSYHASLYRYVEPTSVTPFAPPSRKRAMHAAVIAMMRIAAGLADNPSAKNFNPSETETKHLLANFLKRMQVSEEAERKGIEAELEAIIDKWLSRAQNNRLRFDAKGNKQFRSLIKAFGEKADTEAWPTLHSMRNVDKECMIQVKSS